MRRTSTDRELRSPVDTSRTCVGEHSVLEWVIQQSDRGTD